MRHFLTSSQYAAFLGISLSTLYRWLKKGNISEPSRTFGNHRRFESETSQNALTVLYARVSSAGQKEELHRQEAALQTYASNREHVATISDIGSGLNFKKSGFTKLLKLVMNREVKTIIIQNKDRLSRFGVGLIEIIAAQYGTKLEIINKPTETFESNLVADLMSPIASFSGSIYGRRSHQQKVLVSG